MKFWKIFTLFVASLILLAACAMNSSKTQVGQPVAPAPSAGEKTVSCQMLKGAQAKTDCLQMVNSIIGDMLRREITRAYDYGRCKELPADQVENCQKTIEASGIKGPITEAEAAALETATRFNPEKPDDLTSCTQFTTVGLKEYCEKQLQNRMEQDKLAKAMEGKDSAKCNELKNDDDKQLCKAKFGIKEAPPAPVAPPAQPKK